MSEFCKKWLGSHWAWKWRRRWRRRWSCGVRATGVGGSSLVEDLFSGFPGEGLHDRAGGPCAVGWYWSIVVLLVCGRVGARESECVVTSGMNGWGF